MAEAARSAADTVVVWRPQPGPQAAFVTCPCFEVVYGGARGGGKTDAVLGEWAIHADKYGRNARGLMVRRTLVQLRDTIERAKEIYLPLGAQWREQPSEFVMPGGAILRMRYLERDADAENYQGHAYTRLYVEELTNFPSPKPLNKLKATLRSAHGVPVGMRATCNPGGPGHVWVKGRYIDPAPLGYKVFSEAEEVLLATGERVEVRRDRVFIPAKLTDNPILLNSDPGYVLGLKQSGSAELVRAWLEGDWNIVEGAYFDCWQPDKHVIRPFTVPEGWTRFRSFDWGSARPFSCGWWAIASDHYEHPEGFVIPRGALVRYREWYGCTEPNVGLKLTAEEVARGIAEREAGEKIVYGAADPSIFARDGGPSIAERMVKACPGQHWRKADNKRVPEKGRLGGWDQMRARLIGEDGRPMIYCFSTCTDSIRTIPALQHDENKPEDVDTEGEDHAGDDWRYACMSRPYVRPEAKAAPRRWDYEGQGSGRTITGTTPIIELVRQKERARRMEYE